MYQEWAGEAEDMDKENGGHLIRGSVNNLSIRNFESLLEINLGVRCILIKIQPKLFVPIRYLTPKSTKTFDKVQTWRRDYANLG